MTMKSFVPAGWSWGARTVDKGFEKLCDVRVVALAQELDFALDRLYSVGRLLRSERAGFLRLPGRSP